jgi:hypothetical protein
MDGEDDAAKCAREVGARHHQGTRKDSELAADVMANSDSVGRLGPEELQQDAGDRFVGFKLIGCRCSLAS